MGGQASLIVVIIMADGSWLMADGGSEYEIGVKSAVDSCCLCGDIFIPYQIAYYYLHTFFH